MPLTATTPRPSREHRGTTRRATCEVMSVLRHFVLVLALLTVLSRWRRDCRSPACSNHHAAAALVSSRRWLVDLEHRPDHHRWQGCAGSVGSLRPWHRPGGALQPLRRPQAAEFERDRDLGHRRWKRLTHEGVHQSNMAAQAWRLPARPELGRPPRRQRSAASALGHRRRLAPRRPCLLRHPAPIQSDARESPNRAQPAASPRPALTLTSRRAQ
jgi:hypothetical protein